ncbi:hypothetical protein F7234_04155 [Pseudomonas putida]|nr:hypothetical protein F7234_04155 [Pseudomonas putida]
MSSFLGAAHPVGAGLPANTGVARARRHGVLFAGKPAPTGTAWRHDHWNMNKVSLLNCASNWLAGIGRPNR